MFRFHLVKDQPFQLTWELGEVRDTFLDPWMLSRACTLSPVKIQSSESDNLGVKLRSLMENSVDAEEAHGLPSASGNSGKLHWKLNFEIGIFVQMNFSGDYVRVWGTNEGNLLTRLETVLNSYGLESKVKVGIKEFGAYPADRLSVLTEEVGISELSSDNVPAPGVQLHFSRAWDKAPRDHTNSLKRRAFDGVVTISLIVGRKGGHHFDNFDLFESATEYKSGKKPYVVHKMLKEGLDNDATIIASDGKEIKCHKIILKGQSDVFEAMFNPKSKSLESTTGVIRMEDMCSKSVHAFLAFLYLDDLEDAKADSAVALDLLEAAHKYNVPRLEEQMKRLLLGKPNNWFNVEVAMQLFIFARKIPGGDILKRRATAALKANNSDLWGSPSYKQLFLEDPMAAMELCQLLVSGGPVAGSSAGAGGSEATSQKRRKIN